MPREKIILACSDCKNRNYFTMKNKRLHPGARRVEEVLPSLQQAQAP